MPPPRKEPKEQVTYPSSKRKTPAFKPLRPSKIARTSTTEAEASSNPKPATKKAPPRPKKDASKPQPSIAISDSDLDAPDEEIPDHHHQPPNDEDEDDDDDEDHPPSRPSHNQKPSTAAPSPPISTPPPSSPLPPTSIPQGLLLRLLHQSFHDPATKIDTHAIQVVQKYVEVFVRETIARCALQKREAAERGEVGDLDRDWLELEDLEKVAAGMFLGFE